MKPITIIAIAAFILGLIAYHIFLTPEVTETVRIETRTETDTVYQVIRDTVEVSKDRIITEYLRDTVIREKTINLSRFRGLEPLTYGNINYSGIVAGELIKIGFTTDFDIPQVTNTIYETKTITRTIEPKGSFWIGGLLSQDIQFTGMAAYQKRNWKIVYQYDLASEQHSGGVMFNLFGR